MTLMMSLTTMVSFGQSFTTTKSSTMPLSKQETVEWVITDTSIVFVYTHPKRVKLLEEYLGTAKTYMIVSEIKINSGIQKAYYCTQGDIICRVTVTEDIKQKSYIVIYEVKDTFNDTWTKSVFFN